MHFRSIFLSDTHLGSPDCQAELLLEFLRNNTCDELYLLGDIVDIWRLQRKAYWRTVFNDVLSYLLDLPDKGTTVTYVPGNHDDVARNVLGSSIGGIRISGDLVYKTSRGKRLLLIHGDCLDEQVSGDDWQHRFGGDLYDLLMVVSRWCSSIRQGFGMGHWSLAAHIKNNIDGARAHIRCYEYAAARKAAMRFLDGVICGHIHHPNLTDVEGILYVNCGDWVEHCTAFVETVTGELVLIDWVRERGALMETSSASAVQAEDQAA